MKIYDQIDYKGTAPRRFAGISPEQILRDVNLRSFSADLSVEAHSTTMLIEVGRRHMFEWEPPLSGELVDVEITLTAESKVMRTAKFEYWFDEMKLSS